ncbi:hypothetical protein MPK66_gp053 [Erwinia phage pEa_SNUABM_2]|uniref:Uncharacterized protein n=1 Tax=Erwinia phage pEa_SNUABM_2 TaxID=2869547 RepID=A0AAE7XPQ9_9CAUD|nr:hypothetical protein MPK66_gp053 [Erwinia phage pEa_SNUABM_2]QZE59297.1 hypothetical protein pEaSNUABM2_00053 [Erwinia phage pEa_SNUABM_2]QZE59633.1 hypothetical protein pEaSNUABM39_00053 [Erwinia phage pEa_SNUABM_39]
MSKDGDREKLQEFRDELDQDCDPQEEEDFDFYDDCPLQDACCAAPHWDEDGVCTHCGSDPR